MNRPTTVDANQRTFQVILIPCHDANDIIEETVSQPAEQALSAMFDHAKRHFRNLGQVTVQGSKDLLRSVKEQAPNARDDVVRAVLDFEMCQVVQLVPNTKEFDWIGWNLVVDDKAKAKGLSVNRRATELARACGLSVEIIGDAFVVKQFDDDVGFYRMNVEMKDLRSDAPWITRVFESRRRQLLGNNNNSTTPMINTFDGNKNAGNRLFGEKQWLAAVAAYGRAKSLASNEDEIAVIESNLSSTWLAMGQHEKAIEAAEGAIRAKPTWAKAWGRKGAALEARGDCVQAHAAYSKANELLLNEGKGITETKLKRDIEEALQRTSSQQ